MKCVSVMYAALYGNNLKPPSLKLTWNVTLIGLLCFLYPFIPIPTWETHVFKHTRQSFTEIGSYMSHPHVGSVWAAYNSLWNGFMLLKAKSDTRGKSRPFWGFRGLKESLKLKTSSSSSLFWLLSINIWANVGRRCSHGTCSLTWRWTIVKAFLKSPARKLGEFAANFRWKGGRPTFKVYEALFPQAVCHLPICILRSRSSEPEIFLFLSLSKSL